MVLVVSILQTVHWARKERKGKNNIVIKNCQNKAMCMEWARAVLL